MLERLARDLPAVAHGHCRLAQGARRALKRSDDQGGPRDAPRDCARVHGASFASGATCTSVSETMRRMIPAAITSAPRVSAPAPTIVLLVFSSVVAFS